MRDGNKTEEIMRVLYEQDIMGLRSLDCPPCEYRSEAREIALKVKEKGADRVSCQETEALVKEVLRKSFYPLKIAFFAKDLCLKKAAMEISTILNQGD